MDEPLFVLTVHRDGRLVIDGHGQHEKMPEILRMIAASLEAGDTVLHEQP